MSEAKDSSARQTSVEISGDNALAASRTGAGFVPDKKFFATAREIINKYPKGRQRSAVLPLLQLAQRSNQIDHCLVPEAIATIADLLQIPEIRVYEVASFYTMFRLQPTGKYHIQVCGTTPCMLCGAAAIKQELLNQLGIKENQRSADGLFTVTEVECLGACVNAPVAQINDDFCQNLTVAKVKQLIAELREDNLASLDPAANPVAMPLHLSTSPDQKDVAVQQNNAASGSINARKQQ